MSAESRVMALTAELVRLCHRDIPDPGPLSKYDYFVEADYDVAVDKLMAGKPDGPLWVFAYGSLLWKPEFEVATTSRALAKDWHRSFCLKLLSHRGTPERPGLMMCLDRGGQCEGAVLQIPEQAQALQIRKLLYREIGSHEALESVRWIDVETPEGERKALAFYAHPEKLDLYVGQLPVEEVTSMLASACGHWGSGAEYLYKTVLHLEELGIHDEALWLLQERVAAKIREQSSGELN